MSPMPAVTLSLLTVVTLVAGLEAKVHSQGEQQHHLEPPAQPYLGSYQVEDSCQFLVCGQDFSQEFGVGVRPSQGSCSGDCDQLAASLVTNRFSREFLWSSCARMCQDKYTLHLFRSVSSMILLCYSSTSVRKESGVLLMSLFENKMMEVNEQNRQIFHLWHKTQS